MTDDSTNTYALDVECGDLSATLPAGTSEPPSAAPDPAKLRHHPLR
jgi:hypothetical protein